MSNRWNVYIPLVKQGETSQQQLLHVYSEPYLFGNDTDDILKKIHSEQKAINKSLNPIVSNLRRIALYQSACIAASAVKRLGLKKPRCAFYQWFKPQAWLEHQRLYPGREIPCIEGNSAELGLALVLLASGANSKHTRIIATGRLSEETLDKDNEQDTRIAPIGFLKEKLEILLEEFISNKEEIICFIPHSISPENTSNIEYNNEIQALIAKLANNNIKVIAIEFLSQAATYLKAHKAAYTSKDKILRWFICLLAPLLLSISTGYLWWKNHPISMQFVNSETDSNPFLICLDSLTAKPLANGAIPILYSNNTIEVIGWKVKLSDPTNWDNFFQKTLGFQGYYLAVASISEHSPPAIHAIQENTSFTRKQAGELWEKRWQFKLPEGETEEENVLILLAQRHAPFYPEQILSGLEQKNGLNAKAEYIKQHSTSSLEFWFQIQKGESLCSKENSYF